MKRDKSRGRKKVNYTKIALCAVVIILIAYFGVSAIKIVNLNKEKEEVTAYHQELLQNKEDLQLKLDNISSADYIESQARRDLKLVKPNELLFIFSERDSDSAEENAKDTVKDNAEADSAKNAAGQEDTKKDTQQEDKQE